MSRIGKKTLEIPRDVSVSVNNNIVNVVGVKGKLDYKIPDQISVLVDQKLVIVSKCGDNKNQNNLWGLTRSLISNMITGVSVGFVKVLEFNGVGYKANLVEDKLVLNLGYSHNIEFKIPDGISLSVKGNKIEVSGISKELVGFVCAKIRMYRKPEPYKGKGVKYLNETIIRKAGKTGSK